MKTKKIASTAVFTALTCVMTIAIRIPIAGGSGYLNFGDIFIFITAICLGPLAGAFAGGVGSCIADLIGYPLYAPFTLVIKGLEGLICGLIGIIITKKKLSKPIQITLGITGMVIGGTIMAIGYFATDCALVGLAGGIIGLPFNAIQASVSVAIAAPLVYIGQLRRISEKFGFISSPMSKVISLDPPSDNTVNASPKSE